jgi:cytochrome bd-type quinol oxidase subunit 2
VRISIALADSASFFDGVLFVLLVIATAALIWTMLSAKVREPLNAFTCLLAIATIGLVIVSFLQWRTLDKTDETFRAGERAFVFVTHNAAEWQPAQMINGQIVRFYPVVWENSGNSPTRDLTLEMHCPELQN